MLAQWQWRDGTRAARAAPYLRWARAADVALRVTPTCDTDVCTRFVTNVTLVQHSPDVTPAVRTICASCSAHLQPLGRRGGLIN